MIYTRLTVISFWVLLTAVISYGQTSTSCPNLVNPGGVKPQLFLRDIVQPNRITQSWNGKILRLDPQINPPDEAPPTFWNVETHQSLSAALTRYGLPVGFTKHDRVLGVKQNSKGLTYCVRNLKSGHCVPLKGERVYSYVPPHQFSPGGDRLTMESRGVISVWHTQTGTCFHRVHYSTVSTRVNDIGPTFSPDRTLLAAVGINGAIPSVGFVIKLIDTRTGKTRFTLPVYTYYWIGFSPDSQIFWAVTSSPADWQLRFWDTRSGKSLWALKSQGTGNFTPDGKLYGIPRERDFALFEARTGALKRTLSGPHDNQCTAWNFSFDGKGIWAANYADEDSQTQCDLWLWPVE